MNVGLFVTRAAQSAPERRAIVCGERALTYGELDARTEALAATFSHLGLRRGDRVGILSRNRSEVIEGMLAVWKAGAAVVPLNARLVADEVAYHLADSQARALIHGPEFDELVERVADRLPDLRYRVSVGGEPAGSLAFEELIADGRGRECLSAETGDEDIAWLFYTSGTTGRPKGAILTHANLTFMAVGWIADLMQLEPEDVGLHAAPLSHGAGFHAVALAMVGCTQVILRGRSFDVAELCATVERHRVTNTWLVPTQIKMLVDHPASDRHDLSSLRWVLYGGSPMYASDLRRALDRFGPIFVQLYGQGETPMTITVLRRQEHLDAERPVLESCGRARSGIEVRVVDREDRPLPPREPGEVCVRGPTVMRGYWGRPDATEQALRGGWLHTGDIGAFDNRGFLYLLDRSKDLIITGGANVYPREVEDALAEHPAVGEACVFGVPHPIWGEAVTAVVVASRELPAEDELRQFLRERIADYKRPKTIHFAEALPRNAYGKVLRRELRDRIVREQRAGAEP